jgi:hypothetical protein
MTIAYPSNLPTILSASKGRAQGASFAATAPGAGKLYVQRSGFDVPVLWNVQFRFTQAQAQQFKAWFETDIQRGLLDFTMPIRTEFGMVEHMCRFLPDGLGDCREDGQSWSYSAKIIARARAIPQGYLVAMDLIIALHNWDEWMEVLDIALTETME